MANATGEVLGISGRILNPCRDKKGYMRVQPRRDGKVFKRGVHVLVLEAFRGPRPPGMIGRHLNGQHDDNRLVNLVYGTHKQNAQDSLRHGTNFARSKTHCPAKHEYTDENTWTSKYGKRQCRECRRERDRQRYHREKAAEVSYAYPLTKPDKVC